jgi:hypothetical protein
MNVREDVALSVICALMAPQLTWKPGRIYIADWHLLNQASGDVIIDYRRRLMGQDELACCSIFLADELQLCPVSQTHLVECHHD